MKAIPQNLKFKSLLENSKITANLPISPLIQLIHRINHTTLHPFQKNSLNQIIIKLKRFYANILHFLYSSFPLETAIDLSTIADDGSIRYMIRSTTIYQYR